MAAAYMLSLTVDGKISETKLQISAINTVARASGCAPDDLPRIPRYCGSTWRPSLPRWRA